MTTSGSSIISALGAGSGIDFGSLARDLSAASFAAQRGTIDARTAQLEARISAASSLRSAITGLASALGDRLRAGDLAPRANIANPALASVSLTPGISPQGSYSLEVTQLAGSQRLVLPPMASASDPVGEGTFTLRLGTVSGAGFTEDTARAPVTITMAAGETLADLASRINTASGGAVSAQVLTGTAGAQLVLSGRQGGANGFVVETTGTGPIGGLGWNPASDAGQLRVSARDAVFLFNTVEMRSASNTVTGLPEGIGLQLNAANTGAPTTITFGNDRSAISGVMGDFVSALNEVVDQLNTIGSPLGGELGNDAGVRQLRRELAELSRQVVMPGAAPGDPRTLGDLGLRLNRDGTFTLDNAQLDRALTETPRAVSAMFTTGVFGVFATMDRLARNATRVNDPGSLGGSLTRLQRQMQSSSERLDKIAQQQERLREQLTRQFSASERRVNNSQTTLAFLQQQIDVWTAPQR